MAHLNKEQHKFKLVPNASEESNVESNVESNDEIDVITEAPQSEHLLNKLISDGTILKITCCTIYSVYIICILVPIAMVIFAIIRSNSISVILGFIITLITTYIASTVGIFAAWKIGTIRDITEDVNEKVVKPLNIENEKLNESINKMDEVIETTKTHNKEITENVAGFNEEIKELEGEKIRLHGLTDDFKKICRYCDDIYNKMGDFNKFKKEMSENYDLIPILRRSKSKLFILKLFYEIRSKHVEQRARISHRSTVEDEQKGDELYVEQQRRMDEKEWENFITQLETRIENNKDETTIKQVYDILGKKQFNQIAGKYKTINVDQFELQLDIILQEAGDPDLGKENRKQ